MALLKPVRCKKKVNQCNLYDLVMDINHKPAYNTNLNYARLISSCNCISAV